MRSVKSICNLETECNTTISSLDDAVFLLTNQNEEKKPQCPEIQYSVYPLMTKTRSFLKEYHNSGKGFQKNVAKFKHIKFGKCLKYGIPSDILYDGARQGTGRPSKG